MADPNIRDYIGIRTFTVPVPQNIFQDPTDPNNVYYCWAAPGTPEDDANWMIAKQAKSGGLTRMRYADGEGKYNKKVSLRASYNYDV